MSVATSTHMALSEKHFNQIINTNAKLKLSPAISVHNTTQLAIVAPSHYSTPKQMRGYLGVCNWYSIYIPQYASLAAPQMDSFKGKYQRAPEGGKCKVHKDRNFIEWTETMRQSFAKIKEALCEKCALYIPNDTGEYAIHPDASDFGIGGVLEQQMPDGS